MITTNPASSCCGDLSYAARKWRARLSGLKTGLKTRLFSVNFRDLGSTSAEILGIGSISAGFGWYSPGLGLISGGIGLLALGVAAGLDRQPEQ